MVWFLQSVRPRKRPGESRCLATRPIPTSPAWLEEGCSQLPLAPTLCQMWMAWLHTCLKCSIFLKHPMFCQLLACVRKLVGFKFQIWVVFRPYLGWMIEITSISVFLCTVFLYYICGMEKHQPESTFDMTWWHRSGHASWCQALEMLRLGTLGTSRAIPCHSPEIFTPGPGNTQGTLNLW